MMHMSYACVIHGPRFSGAHYSLGHVHWHSHTVIGGAVGALGLKTHGITASAPADRSTGALEPGGTDTDGFLIGPGYFSSTFQ